jgi:hypothetical protein
VIGGRFTGTHIQKTRQPLREAVIEKQVALELEGLPFVAFEQV